MEKVTGIGGIFFKAADARSLRDDTDYGRFGWATDPEGNRFELWQPPKK
jgi:predicted enzyme related to lactoylglutathione lyase